MPAAVGEQDLVAVAGQLIGEEGTGGLVLLDEQDRVSSWRSRSVTRLLPVFVARRRSDATPAGRAWLFVGLADRPAPEAGDPLGCCANQRRARPVNAEGELSAPGLSRLGLDSCPAERARRACTIARSPRTTRSERDRPSARTAPGTPRPAASRPTASDNSRSWSLSSASSNRRLEARPLLLAARTRIVRPAMIMAR